MNKSNDVMIQDVLTFIDDIQLQLDQDYYPVWTINPLLYYHNGPSDPPSGHWKLIFIPTNGQLNKPFGEHVYNTSTGIPTAYIYTNHINEFGFPMSVVMSHELLEMITNPRKESVTIEGINYMKEICDPIGSSSYQVNTTEVSNFVYPAWFGVDTLAPFDHIGLLDEPLKYLNS
jgi:hypothetical protein